MNKTPTPETDSAYTQRPNEGAWDFKVRQEKTMESLERERDVALWCHEKCFEDRKQIIKELNILQEQVRLTIMENLHLADGDNCTLKRLKDAIGFSFDSPENA